MVYVTVKEETEQKLHFSREPSNNSWALLIGFCAFGLGAAYYGNVQMWGMVGWCKGSCMLCHSGVQLILAYSWARPAILVADHIIWKVIYVSLGLLVGVSCLEDWEECELNKETGELRLKRHSAWDLILSPFTAKQNVIVANLPDVIDVRVTQEKVNFFGNTYQVILVMSTGMSLGITESSTFGSTKEHYEIAEKVRNFLGLDSIKEPQQWAQHDESSSSNGEDTADDFEQIDKSELLDETLDKPNLHKDIDEDSGKTD